jgi:hypothetical protein
MPRELGDDAWISLVLNEGMDEVLDRNVVSQHNDINDLLEIALSARETLWLVMETIRAKTELLEH